MSQKYNIYDDTKTEIINEIKESRILKILQYGGLAVIGLYGIGFIFKVLAFTNNNYNKFKSSIKV